MTFNAKLAIVGIVGVALVLLISMAGCGEVTAGLSVDGGSAGAGGKVEISAGGAAGEMSKLDSGAAGAAGATVTFGKPLGAGCTADAECGSTICDGATRACCDGHSDMCNTCVGGYKTPVADGPITCGVCEGGTLIPLQDGTACGTSVCGGTPQPTGQGPMPPAGIACLGSDAKSYSADCYYPTATNSTCRAGVCLAASTNCSTVACPANCTKKYVGCYLNYNGNAANGARCYCVDTSDQICTM